MINFIYFLFFTFFRPPKLADCCFIWPSFALMFVYILLFYILLDYLDLGFWLCNVWDDWEWEGGILCLNTGEETSSIDHEEDVKCLDFQFEKTLLSLYSSCRISTCYKILLPYQMMWFGLLRIYCNTTVPYICCWSWTSDCNLAWIRCFFIWLEIIKRAKV